MTIQLLIDAIVRQTTVLIANLATAGGVRAPLAHVANQVFLDLARELARVLCAGSFNTPRQTDGLPCSASRRGQCSSCCSPFVATGGLWNGASDAR